MKRSKENLLMHLHNFLSTTELDHHNMTTYEWSRGYRKAILDIIHFIENKEPETMDHPKP